MCFGIETHETQLLRAAKAGDVTAVKQLLYGRLASPNAAQGASSGYAGWTPLHWAASEGHTEMIKLLLARGAKPNQLTTAHRWTPLHLAASKAHTSAVQALLAGGADAGQLGSVKALLACSQCHSVYQSWLEVP